ncbi:type I restriction endonuclease subunit R [Actinocrinis puniceicyclus]|uniref:Type I restriction enzyme endonuclease subunit n=1 Tax=Actinocrinis puniceicyclus TaxID=977794 RepID=A0A8J7WKH0_9ACTN|nr:HsdR family type I site-specific deoxyribonuclease [Actinocrinis puniceicyclus]MBS2963961.1 type I restriction endonuclease subunit R [Actinocrinis puniceicyclus]
MAESGPEYIFVESPLIAQLEAMGWKHVRGSVGKEREPAAPRLSRRESFTDSILETTLRRQLRALNLDSDGQEWLDEQRISTMAAELTRLGGADSLLEANTKATSLLLAGTTVPGRADWDQGRLQPVQYIDWSNPERNEFLAVSQFRMDEPGTQGAKCVVPDLVLFVNGIPLVVIECKKPTFQQGALSDAITQLRRYANQRGASTPEGSERLFRTVQLTVATTGDTAKLGTFTSRPQDYAVWRDPYPLSKDEVRRLVGRAPDSVSAIEAQEILVAAVLDPARLLDLVKNFVVFMEVEGGSGKKRVKIAPRYQQYRAVSKTVERLRTGKTKAEDGDTDKRGGIIWHTQGSGKSLTMVFLVRKLRSTPDLAQFKVVLVTDRKQLQKQLAETAVITGEKSDVANRARQVPQLLGRPGAGLVFVMIQKQIDTEKQKQEREASELSLKSAPGWGLINADESVLILVDEAHRSHGSALHQNLMESLPNAARIGFTGTPIIMNAKKATTRTFGEFIDKYRLAEAEADEAIVPIIYEGRITKAVVKDGDTLDDALAEYFPELTDEEYDQLQERYARAVDVLNADDMLRKKARDMLNHYVVNALSDGFKAQVVAHSRGVAVAYRQAFLDARRDLVAEAERALDALLDKPAEELTGRQAIQAAAKRNLALLKAMDFVPVISASNNEEAAWDKWTADKAQERAVSDFLKPFPDPESLPEPSDDDGTRPVAVLIVRTMLLTGFDAPIEQVMYLDRRMKEAELLQAIARVNRTAQGKTAGYVVDYAGISKPLQEALAAYAAEDVEVPVVDIDMEIKKLKPCRDRLRLLFADHPDPAKRVTPADDAETVERCVDALEDAELRADFTKKLREFLNVVKLVMPRQEAGEYMADARLYAYIGKWARTRYQDSSDFDPTAYSDKMKELIDDHVMAVSVRQAIPPSQLTAADFTAKVEALPGAKAQASTMAHAIRHHIDLYYAEDPAAYQSLLDRLNKILQDHLKTWEEQVELFSQLVEEAQSIKVGGGVGVDEWLVRLSPLERAAYGLLTQPLTDGVISPDDRDHMVSVSAEVHQTALKHAAKKNFWSNATAKRDLRTAFFRLLLDRGYERADANALADGLFDMVGHHKHELARSR